MSTNGMAVQYDIGEGALQFDAATSYARHLATYITDASSIRAACINHFGRGVELPSLDSIRNMVLCHRQKQPIRRDLAKALTNDDGLPWRPAAVKGFKGPRVTRPDERKYVYGTKTNYYTPAKVRVAAKPARQALSLEGPLGRRIVQAVADRFDMSYGEVIGTFRNVRFVGARSVAVQLLREQTYEDGTPRFSFPTIGRLLGGRDHSTVIHAYNTHPERECQHPALAIALDDLRAQFGGQEA